MLKTLLTGAAALAALPVIAQTTTPTGNPTTNTPAGATTTPNSVATGNQANTNGNDMPNTVSDQRMQTMGTTTPDAMSGTDVASDETAADVDAATPTVADGSLNTGSMNPATDRSMSASNMQPNAYAGVGGPAEGRTYPACSRTVTDSCVQRGGR